MNTLTGKMTNLFFNYIRGGTTKAIIGNVADSLKVIVTDIAVAALMQTQGYDNNPSGTIYWDGTPNTGDIVYCTIGATQVSYTVQGGDTLVNVAKGIADAINTDVTLKPIWLANGYYNHTHIECKIQGSEYNGTTFSENVGATSVTSSHFEDDTQLIQKFKKVAVYIDPVDRRVGKLTVTGDVGVTARADNPIHITISDEMNTSDIIHVFVDKNADAGYYWYINALGLSNEADVQMFFWHGFIRDREEQIIAAADQTDFYLDYEAIYNTNYLEVKKDSSVQGFNKFEIIDDITDDTKSIIRFGTPPGVGKVIDIKYTACDKKYHCFVKARTAEPVPIPTPVKIDGDAGEFIILGASEGTGLTIANIIGFKQVKGT